MGIISIFPKNSNSHFKIIFQCLSSGTVSEKPNEQSLRKLQKDQFWAKKCLIYPILDTIKVYLRYFSFDPLMPVGNKRSYVLKQRYIIHIILQPDIKGLNGQRKYFIRSLYPNS